ncbi:hypothetical protein [Nocardia miyunensis]|uniref:hypothetical protein n=1 Tax=Nocardia miyunensis TaxID=282684 RepID=UPI00082B500C|nr:hypothetical protein [Nocardia miyunensis]
MNQRSAKALSVAALGIAATGLFIPQAAAQSAPNLAPGLDCEGLQCTNNSNNTYIINFDAVCLNPGDEQPTSVTKDIDQISPHQRKTLDKNCPAHRAGGKHHDELVNGDVIDAYYTGATVIPARRPGTGSAG